MSCPIPRNQDIQICESYVRRVKPGERTNDALIPIKEDFKHLKDFCFVRSMGGGKSGAFLFQMRCSKSKQTCGDAPEKCRMIKVYIDAYKSPHVEVLKEGYVDIQQGGIALPEYKEAETKITDDNLVNNIRPFREIYAQCAFSGRAGYNCLYSVYRIQWKHVKSRFFGDYDLTPAFAEKGKSLVRPADNFYHNTGDTDPEYYMNLMDEHYVLIMEISNSAGSPLLSTNLRSLTYSQCLGTALEICSVWSSASRRLNSHWFVHWDYHPDNIFVDTKNEKRPPANIPIPNLSVTRVAKIIDNLTATIPDMNSFSSSDDRVQKMIRRIMRSLVKPIRSSCDTLVKTLQPYSLVTFFLSMDVMQSCLWNKDEKYKNICSIIQKIIRGDLTFVRNGDDGKVELRLKTGKTMSLPLLDLRKGFTEIREKMEQSHDAFKKSFLSKKGKLAQPLKNVIRSLPLYGVTLLFDYIALPKFLDATIGYDAGYTSLVVNPDYEDLSTIAQNNTLFLLDEAGQDLVRRGVFSALKDYGKSFLTSAQSAIESVTTLKEIAQSLLRLKREYTEELKTWTLNHQERRLTKYVQQELTEHDLFQALPPMVQDDLLVETSKQVHNLFLTIKYCFDVSDYNIVKIEYPTVTAIDFDLVSSKRFPDLEEEHRNKLQSSTILTERTVAWASQWIPFPLLLRWISLMKSALSVETPQYVDFAHLMTYVLILSLYAKLKREHEGDSYTYSDVAKACKMIMKNLSGLLRATAKQMMRILPMYIGSMERIMQIQIPLEFSVPNLADVATSMVRTYVPELDVLKSPLKNLMHMVMNRLTLLNKEFFNKEKQFLSYSNTKLHVSRITTSSSLCFVLFFNVGRLKQLWKDKTLYLRLLDLLQSSYIVVCIKNFDALIEIPDFEIASNAEITVNVGLKSSPSKLATELNKLQGLYAWDTNPLPVRLHVANFDPNEVARAFKFKIRLSEFRIKNFSLVRFRVLNEVTLYEIVGALFQSLQSTENVIQDVLGNETVDLPKSQSWTGWFKDKVQEFGVRIAGNPYAAGLIDAAFSVAGTADKISKPQQLALQRWVTGKIIDYITPEKMNIKVWFGSYPNLDENLNRCETGKQQQSTEHYNVMIDTGFKSPAGKGYIRCLQALAGKRMDYALDCLSTLTAEKESSNFITDAITSVIWQDFKTQLPEIMKGMTLQFQVGKGDQTRDYNLLTYDQKNYRYVVLKSLKEYGLQWGEFVYTTFVRLFVYFDIKPEYPHDWYEQIREKILNILDKVCFVPYSLYNGLDDNTGSVRDWSEAVFCKLANIILELKPETRNSLHRDIMLEYDTRRLFSDVRNLVSFAMDSALDHIFDGTDAMMQAVVSDLGLQMIDGTLVPTFRQKWNALNNKFKQYLVKSRTLVVSDFTCSSMWESPDSKFRIQSYRSNILTIVGPAKQGCYATKKRFDQLFKLNSQLKEGLAQYPKHRSNFALLDSYCVYNEDTKDTLDTHSTIISQKVNLTTNSKNDFIRALVLSIKDGAVYFVSTKLHDEKDTHISLAKFIRENIHDYEAVRHVLQELYQLLLYTSKNMNLTFMPYFSKIFVVQPELRVVISLQDIASISALSKAHLVFASEMSLHWQYLGETPSVRDWLKRLLFIDPKKKTSVPWESVYRELDENVKKSNTSLTQVYSTVSTSLRKKYAIYVNGTLLTKQNA